ncbi:MAG: DUF1972 domain-containing protein [candidate division Zixibacteria bacterium]|nr:DUF1972 domain-containing protein [candidate division Zixibacteria bacterium]
MSSDTKRIAFCGTRGLPANYGGFETAVDEISKRFVANGHGCDVFCRGSRREGEVAEFEGRKLIYVTGSKHRSLDTFVSAFQTGWRLFRNRRDYRHAFWFNNANLPGILMTWFAGIPMSVNTDGLEWRRAKWSWPFKLYYLAASFLVACISRRLISDSVAIQRFYRKHFLTRSFMIPYGAPDAHEMEDFESVSLLSRYGLRPDKYFLQITRFEPDNLPLETARAFTESRLSIKGYKMVLVGFRDATPYAMAVKSLDGESGVVVLNAIYESKILTALRGNCYCYVHGNSVGGTNPALLEAMASSPRIMAIDCEFSREVLGTLGLCFDPKNIVPMYKNAAHAPDQRAQLSERVRQQYQWEAVAKAYMQLVERGTAIYRPVNPSLRKEPAPGRF